MAKTSDSHNGIPTSLCFVVEPEEEGQRLDLFLSFNDQLVDISRSRVQKLIRSDNVLVNGLVRKAGYTVHCDDVVTIDLPPPKPMDLVPEEVPFEILYEDDDLIVVSKPPGIVVHPACGHDSGTLVHGLLNHCRNLSGINGELRPGIVHRLDKDTSGVLVVAKNEQVHHSLVNQFKNRQVEKVYHAIVDGRPERSSGSIILPIGRHPVSRKKMAVREEGGRDAVTHWKILENFSSEFTYIEVRLETGRTHQIRVHMANIGHPVSGDSLYGKKKSSYVTFQINRQCLHAFILAFTHPNTGEKLRFTAPVWQDMQETLNLLRKD